ncbi:MAG: translation initiation factor IF-2 [Patescibacteria group bacterium]
MNVTELARKLNIPTNELKVLLPKLGFDIGRKAIKVNDNIAERIMKRFQTESKLIEELRRPKQEIVDTPAVSMTNQTITIPPVITVRDFADLIGKPVSIVMQELMKNGILVNLNENIDYDTANIIAQDFGFSTTIKVEKSNEETLSDGLDTLLLDDEKNLVNRPPVVIVMGHVDHGKTQLLDTIRKTNVIAGEAGGITQHIGAYQVMVPTKEVPSSRPRIDEGGVPRSARDDHAGRAITFIDTPGHEAFMTMRSRGARVADIAIVVIAADDGIKPQTEEVFQIIDNAKLPYIVAINKIDKSDAQLEKVKQQLANANRLPEDWGGKVICVPVSAKTGQGIDDLLEHLLLLAEVEKDRIQANPSRPAIGTIIESHVDKGEGIIATAIILTGTLHTTDVVQVGQVVGKIRLLKDDRGKPIKEAGPSTPVRLQGLKNLPEVGDILQAIRNPESLKKIMKQMDSRQKTYRDQQSWRMVKTKSEQERKDEKVVDIILKTDVLGSQEAIVQALEALSTPKIKVNVVKKGLGNIMDMDVLRAEGTELHIYGFNVDANARAADLARDKGIIIKTYRIIYDLLNDVKKEVEKMVGYKKEIVELGRVKILAIFRSEKGQMIIGGQVTKGKIETGGKCRVMRAEGEIGSGLLTQLQQAKQPVSSVPSGSECGMEIKTSQILQVGDFLETYREEMTKDTSA